jgi:hypothetical protein
VGAAKRIGKEHFEVSAHFAASHPLRNTAFRGFGFRGYAMVFGIGGAFIYAVYIAFLGPAFVTGICRNFAANATHVWVVGALECLSCGLNTTSAGGVVPSN